MRHKKEINVIIERKDQTKQLKTMSATQLHAFIPIFNKDAKIVSVKLTKQNVLSRIKIKE